MKTISTTTTLLGIATAAVAFAMTASTPVKASTLLEKCDGNSRAQVEGCCTAYVKKNGKPYWMTETSSSCGSVVACGYRYKEYCYIELQVGSNVTRVQDGGKGQKQER